MCSETFTEPPESGGEIWETTSISSTCQIDGPEFLQSIRKWAIQENVNHSQLSSLLKVLQQHDCFAEIPVDARTIMATSAPSKTLIKTWEDGDFVYFGLTEEIIKYPDIKEFVLQINVDGLPLFHSSRLQLWPILGNFVGVTKEPFVIGIFCGDKKPSDPNVFLNDFVEDFKRTCVELTKSNIKLYIRSFICDAPARAYIKGIKGHTGYYGCDKCEVEGSTVQNRVVFLETDCRKRTDESFRSRRNEDHHRLTELKLEEIPGLDMIENFPVDYMHLVCIGVTKKFLTFLVKGKPGAQKLTSLQIRSISTKLKLISTRCVCEFARKPRGLEDMDRWKATEWRQFLLYSGFVVLKDIISPESFMLFKCLATAIRVLCSRQHYIELNEYANSLLLFVVQGFHDLFGAESVSYNVHSLSHLAADSLRLGVLDDFSAFKFESKLGKLKRLIRSPKKPLVQIVNRLNEIKLTEYCVPKLDEPKLKRRHNSGPLLPNIIGVQFRCLTLGTFTLKCKAGNYSADSFLLTTGAALFQLMNLCEVQDKEIRLLGYIFNKSNQLFDRPCDSSVLNLAIYENSHSGLVSITLDKVKCKCQVYFESYGVVAIPLLHSQ